MRNLPKLLLIPLLAALWLTLASGSSHVLWWLQEQAISVAMAQDVPEPPAPPAPPPAPQPPAAPAAPAEASSSAASSSAAEASSQATEEPSPAARPARRHAKSAAAASASASSSSAAAAAQEEEDSWEHDRPRYRHQDNDRVSIGHDLDVPSNEQGGAAVAVFGNATAAGDSDSVVAVFGNATAKGPVGDSVVAILGDARASASVGDAVVAVMGDVYVNGPVENAVAVLGNIELGPQARVTGDVTLIGGTLTRDERAVVHGNITHIWAGGSFNWTHPWVQNALLYGRPLAVAPGLSWLWGIALGFVVLYALLGLLFPVGLERCVRTFEHHPGESVLVALAGLVLMPLVAALLFFTVIGLPALLLALVAMTMFGKAAIFAWMGRRLTGFLGDGHSTGHTLLAILVGCGIALALYCVPVVGLFAFNLLGLLGFGVALNSLLLVSRSNRRQAPPPFTMPPPPFRGAPQEPPWQGRPEPQPGPQPGPAAASAAAGAAGPGAASAAGPSRAGATMASAARFPGFTPAQLLGMPRAEFWPRMLALLIDVVLVTMVLSMTLYYRPHDLQLVTLAAYGAVMWKVKGATIGGIICNHKVVRLDGRELDWPTVIVRALGCLLSLLPISLGFLWIAIDENRQAWHDKIAGTLVVRVPPGTSQFL